MLHALLLIVNLTGRWHFHPGDDPRWAQVGVNDRSWQTLDLTAPPGAHDGDVGLIGYVPGWSAHGHATYAGYAWYRLKVRLQPHPGEQFAVAGPPDVDDVYQLYVNGRLFGGAGDFRSDPPAIYSVQPRYFPLPPSLVGDGDVTIAIRTWMSSDDLGDPQAGGMHIAPVIGEANDVRDHYYWEWVQTFRGYIVEVVEGALFLVLAIMAGSLMAVDPHHRAYLWLAGALTSTAIVRLNQALFFWGQFETVQMYEIVIANIVIPLGIGLWAMAWWRWFRIHSMRWMPIVIAAATVVLIVAQFANIGSIESWTRLLFVAIALVTIALALRENGARSLFSIATMLVASVGIFASEVSQLGFPGIWFPFGTGVSRTQYAYLLFDVLLFILLEIRLWTSRSSRATSPSTS